MITLGIDHALYEPCGMAVVAPNGRTPVLDALLLNYKRGLSADERAKMFYSACVMLCDAYGVQAVAVEETYVGDNPHAALVLEHAAGIARAVAVARSLPFVRVSHAQTDQVKATFPPGLVNHGEIPRRLHVHLDDAAAIGWHGSGLAQRAARLKG